MGQTEKVVKIDSLSHALQHESRAGITPEKLNKISVSLSQLIPEIATIKNEIDKYSSVLEEMKRIPGIDLERENVAIVARQKYREILGALCDKVKEIEGRY